MSRAAGPLNDPYLRLKLLASQDLSSKDTADALMSLVSVSLEFLNSECISVPLISHVPNKSYFSFALKKNKSAISRPVNEAQFEPDASTLRRHWSNPQRLSSKELTRLSYTMGTAYSVASDLFDRNNKKGPATFFEIFVGHTIARELGKNPTKEATLPLGSGKSVRMTMDFIFDLGPQKAKIHLAVKASTRERVVQAWAQQRLLDAAYGLGTYRAILVVHSETKLDLVTREVVEICVPDQWLAYQTLLSKMERIYYLDVPDRYSRLCAEYPIIQLKQFGDFFVEKDFILSPAKKHLST